MLYYKRRKRRFVRLKRVLISIVAFLIALIVFCEYHLSNFRPNYIETQAEILSSDVINDAVNATLDKLNYTYDDLSKIVYSTDGEVKAIETDSIKINYLKSEITKAVEDEISKIYDNEIEIPLGSFTDITVLSNWGPNISMNFNLTGSFTAEIVSTLEQSGINQSIHHIKLLLTSNIMTTTLDYSGKITFTTDFEIAQSVIVGEIPSSYGNLYRTY